MFKFVYFLFFLFMLKGQDSIPTWQIIYSKIYHQQFVKENVDHDYELLRKQNEVFQLYVLKYFNIALDIIPIYTGIEWPKNYRINIYPTRSNYSFSHPLTIQYHKNQKFMFYMLIHEAVHHNVLIDFKSPEMMEALCDKVAAKVASLVDDTNIGFHETRVYSKYYTMQKMFVWNLDTLSIQEFWAQNEEKTIHDDALYMDFKAQISHQNKEAVNRSFNLIKETGNLEYIEKSYLDILNFYSGENNYSEIIRLGNDYLKEIKDGAFHYNVLFILATNYLYANKDEEASKILLQIQRSGRAINNYLDDSYLLNGRILSSQKEYTSALKHYFYIIQVLPNAYAKGDAFKNLARIYLRQDKANIASSLYLEAYKYIQKPNHKAQLLIEMSETISADKLNQYKQALVEILATRINKDLKINLEKIYKRIL